MYPILLHRYHTALGAIALVAATAKTIFQLDAPATRRAVLEGLDLSFASVTQTDGPVLIQVMRQTTDGTMSAATPAPLDPADPAALCTATIDATVEPTAGTVLYEVQLTPIGGTLLYTFPRAIILAASTKVALVLTAPQAQTVRGTIAHRE